MLSLRLIRLSFAVAILFGCVATRTAWAQPGGPAFVPGEVIIQYREGATPAAQQAARASVAAAATERISGAARGRGHLELASINAAVPVETAVRRLNADPAVAFAEPNWIYTHTATSNDPYYTNGSLWGMYGDGTSPANQYGSQAGEAWAAGNTGSHSVVVGVIDEGLFFQHTDLAANLGNPGETAGDGIDNDGNGFIDDAYGWDFANNDNSLYDGGNQDKHGTHVSGTIGALGGNGAGVAGVNWNVNIINAKFLKQNGGTTANAIKAVNYFTDLKTNRGLNIVATNNSWGGGGYSQALHDAIIRGANAGILFIAAAGNDSSNNDSIASYPSNYDTTQGTSTQAAASYDGVIAVASITSSGALSSFSNYGATKVDLGAPGSGIYSTLPGNTYGSYNGTSMATPHVTGAAALFASVQPGATAAQIKTAILQSAKPTASLAGKTLTGARLDIGQLINGSPPPVDPGTLSGVVTDSGTAQPIGGATITITGAGLTTQSAGDGTYSIAGIAAGTYSVTAAAAGYAGQTVNGVVISGGATTTQNFALAPPPPVQGALQVSLSTGSQSVFAMGQPVPITATVTDENAQPIGGATVTVTVTNPKGQNYAGTGTTGADGTVSFTFTSSKRDGTGTFVAKATAKKPNYTDGVAVSVVFTVQ